jgi:hypothetical protein
LREDERHVTQQTGCSERRITSLFRICSSFALLRPEKSASLSAATILELTLLKKPGNLAACIFLMLWSISGMLSRVVLPWFVVVLLTGCGKSPETSRPTPASTTEPAQGEKTDAAPATKQPAAGDAATAAALSNASEAALNAALGELTQALRKYSFEHRRLPKTFSELVAAGYVKNMPQAPPGKRFEVDPKSVQVVLVKQ